MDGHVRAMEFRHAARSGRTFPSLPPVSCSPRGSPPSADVTDSVARLYALADAAAGGHLRGRTARDPGLAARVRADGAQADAVPVRVRVAAAALQEGSTALPAIHPLVDLCNAISLAYAIPVAVLDADRIAGPLQVGYADGTESYLAFSGETEQPRPGEVIFADAAGNAHARRWTNRQSALSAVQPGTTTVLIVAEAMHESAAEDVRSLIAAVAAELTAAWPVTTKKAMLSAAGPGFDSGGQTDAKPGGRASTGRQR